MKFTSASFPPMNVSAVIMGQISQTLGIFLRLFALLQETEMIDPGFFYEGI